MLVQVVGNDKKRRMGVYPSVETNYSGEGDESAAFLSLGERLVLKLNLHFDQLMAYRPSLRILF